MEILSEPQTEFICIHTSGLGGGMAHALTICAAFNLSRDKNGETIAEATDTLWYDTRDKKIEKNLKDLDPISRDEANKIDWAFVNILEDIAMNHALSCEW